VRPYSDDLWDPVDVESWAASDDVPSDEPLGTKEKFWVVGPDGRRWLFKFARDAGGAVRGEDWAECMVHLLADLLGIPTATVRLGRCAGRRGVLSGSVVAGNQRLEHGNELLARVDPNYDREERRHNPRYAVAAVRASLEDVGPPAGWPGLADFDAFDVWSGYLLLDAWVAGRDRHHENWAAITDGSNRWLAPSFDHGNALGFQESRDRHAALAADQGRLLRWARRGVSQHFAGRPSLVQLAHDALNLAGPVARSHWLNRLESVSESEVIAAISRAPEALLSDSGHTFVVNLLKLNRERVLRGDPDHA
jgi:hypothetical protein